MLKENIESVLNEIKDGNNLGEKITLVAATKTISADVINQAVSYGIQVVAENKVQEFREKTDKIIGAEQHFIGHLQTNKVKYLVGKVKLIHSVDNLKLAEEISRVAKNRNVIQDVLLEINVGGEESKSGCRVDEAENFAEDVSKLSNINILGLMAMLPKSDDEKYIARLCLQMREIYDTLLSKGYKFKYLSVGMSADYKTAIKNGSNTIRLGTKLFGQRNYGANAR